MRAYSLFINGQKQHRSGVGGQADVEDRSIGWN